MGRSRYVTKYLKIMTLMIAPFAIVVGAFLLVRSWVGKQPDRLAARHRALGVRIWVTALLMLIALFLRQATGGLGFFMAILLVFAIWQRQRLSRQMHQRGERNAP